MKFSELNLTDELLEAISYMGFENATPIQEQAIPIILNNEDLIACAQTGTGKTAAFILPILNKIASKASKGTNTVIIVPTRELALQIDQQIEGLSYFVSVGSIAIYGGGDGKEFSVQKQALTTGTDIIVATPGKLISHLKLGYVKFDQVKHLILDEADRMLDMGFHDDIQTIISYLPKNRQALLFSATMPPAIRQLAKKILKNPKEINLAISKPAAGVDQKLALVHENQKIPLLCTLLNDRKNYESIIVFSSTKSKVSDIVYGLKRKGFPAKGISSNLEQSEREEVLQGFRSRKVRILVATDVMSRGIDIKEINMVVNFDVPGDAEDYVHRVGRTARANTQGEAVTLVNDKDQGKMRRIEQLIESRIPMLEVPSELGEVPQWRTSKPGGGPKNKNRKFHKKKNFSRKPNNDKKRS